MILELSDAEISPRPEVISIEEDHEEKDEGSSDEIEILPPSPLNLIRSPQKAMRPLEAEPNSLDDFQQPGLSLLTSLSLLSYSP